MAKIQQYIMVGAVLVVFIRLWTLKPPAYPSANFDGNPQFDNIHHSAQDVQRPHHQSTGSKQTVPRHVPEGALLATSQPQQPTQEPIRLPAAPPQIAYGAAHLWQSSAPALPPAVKDSYPLWVARQGEAVRERQQPARGRPGSLAAVASRRRPSRRPPLVVSSHARRASPSQQRGGHSSSHKSHQVTHEHSQVFLQEERRVVIEPMEDPEDVGDSPRKEETVIDTAEEGQEQEPEGEEGEEEEEEDGESLEDAMEAAQEKHPRGSSGGGGHPHSDPKAWLSGQLEWLHLLKTQGTSVGPVIMAQDNVFDGRTKYKMWINSQQKTLSLDGPFLGHHLPAHDYAAKPTRQHSTCALVGNSGILLGKGIGKKIDLHDAVMRINYPPVKKYEEDVGSKTTYDFSNRENARRILNQRRFPGRKPSTLIFFEISSHTNREKLFGPLMEKYPEFQIHFVHPDFVFRSMRLWNEIQKEVEAQQHKKFKPKPMSGWLAIMLMSQMCDTLDVYGFEGYNNPHASHPYHYFDKVKAVLQHHSFDFAMEAYRMLGELYDLQMHT